jgi:tetratricopeptide (TPR) repeat protein
LLKAHYYLSKFSPEGLQQGMVYARAAIDADPLYAEAYGYISTTYSTLGFLGLLAPAEAFPKARAAALKTLEIDDSLAHAHAALGRVHLYYDWDWSRAEHELRRAIELNPNYAWVYLNWSDLLMVLGRDEEAIAEARRLVELDPLWAGAYMKLGQLLCYTRDYDRALEQIQRSLELDSNFIWTNAFLPQVYAWKGRYDEGLAACEKLASLLEGKPCSTALRSLILAMAGRSDEAKAILTELKKRPKLDAVALMGIADAYSVLGEKDEAFAFLEGAYQERAGWLIFLGIRPTFDNIRSDPRFADLLRRIGLPQTSVPTPS